MTEARNAPCKCGSGKKWKKCCGSPEKFNEREECRHQDLERWRSERVASEASPEHRRSNKDLRVAMLIAATLGGM